MTRSPTLQGTWVGNIQKQGRRYLQNRRGTFRSSRYQITSPQKRHGFGKQIVFLNNFNNFFLTSGGVNQMNTTEEDQIKGIQQRSGQAEKATFRAGVRRHPILKVAALRYAEYRQLRKELKYTQNALSERKQIEKAKGILMRDLQIDEAEAYRRMRRLAMDKGKNWEKLPK